MSEDAVVESQAEHNVEQSEASLLSPNKEQMSGFEKATLRWARAAVIMSLLAAVFVCAQWWEMHEGGIDTHKLADAAVTQTNLLLMII